MNNYEYANATQAELDQWALEAYELQFAEQYNESMARAEYWAAQRVGYQTAEPVHIGSFILWN